MIKVRRVYDPPKRDDGCRVLVDRLWPRALSKDKARIQLWLRDIAPSDELRKWFAHDPRKWVAFQKKYQAELKGRKGLLGTVQKLEKVHGTVTLLYAARDAQHNNAVALRRLFAGFRAR